ncbi:hypothetical protein HYPBUDRAFT_114749, partial [Hyphopichia burtonii NRRL Y-1933]
VKVHNSGLSETLIGILNLRHCVETSNFKSSSAIGNIINTLSTIFSTSDLPLVIKSSLEY